MKKNILVFLISFSIFANNAKAAIIFEDNFDNRDDWSAPYTTLDQSCSIELGCNVPAGYYGYYVSKSVVSPITENALRLDGINKRGSSGKGLTFWDQTDGSKNWTSDVILGLDFPPQNEIYVQYWIKMQPNYVYYKGAYASMLRKLNHISHYIYNGKPFTFFNDGGFFPTTVNQLRFANAANVANLQNIFFIRPDPSYNGLQPIPTITRGIKDANDIGVYNYFDLPTDGLPIGNWNGTGTEYNSPGMIADGQWHLLTYYLKNNSAPGVADGTYKFWLDGNIQIDATGFIFREAASILPDNIWNFLHIGGNAINPFLGEGVSGWQWYAVDDVVVSSTYMGPDYVIGSVDVTSPVAPTGLSVM